MAQHIEQIPKLNTRNDVLAHPSTWTDQQFSKRNKGALFQSCHKYGLRVPKGLLKPALVERMKGFRDEALARQARADAAPPAAPRPAPAPAQAPADDVSDNFDYDALMSSALNVLGRNGDASEEFGDEEDLVDEAALMADIGVGNVMDPLDPLGYAEMEEIEANWLAENRVRNDSNDEKGNEPEPGSGNDDNDNENGGGDEAIDANDNEVEGSPVVVPGSEVREWFLSKGFAENMDKAEIFIAHKFTLSDIEMLTKTEMRDMFEIDAFVAHRILCAFKREKEGSASEQRRLNARSANANIANANNANANIANAPFSPNRDANGGRSDSTQWRIVPSKSIRYIGEVKDSWQVEFREKVYGITLDEFGANGMDGTIPIDAMYLRRQIDNGTKASNVGKVRYMVVNGVQPNCPIKTGVTVTRLLSDLKICKIFNFIYVEKSYGGRPLWKARILPNGMDVAYVMGTVAERRKFIGFVGSLPNYDFVRLCARTKCERECRALGIIGDLYCPIEATLEEALELNGEAADMAIQARKDATTGGV